LFCILDSTFYEYVFGTACLSIHQRKGGGGWGIMYFFSPIGENYSLSIGLFLNITLHNSMKRIISLPFLTCNLITVMEVVCEM
jgi:hypothetical protein